MSAPLPPLSQGTRNLPSRPAELDLLDDDLSSTERTGLDGIEMPLLLICAIGVVSFMTFAMVVHASLRGFNTPSAETIDELEQTRSVLTAEHRSLLALLDQTPDHAQNLGTDKQPLEQVDEAMDEVRQLTTLYGDVLKRLVALKERARRPPASEATTADDVEYQRLVLIKATLTREVQTLGRKARLGASGKTRAIHVEVRSEGCFVYPAADREQCMMAAYEVVNRAQQDSIDLVVLWVRPGAGQGYREIAPRLDGRGLSVSHEPLPKGESVEAVLAGVRHD